MIETLYNCGIGSAQQIRLFRGRVVPGISSSPGILRPRNQLRRCTLSVYNVFSTATRNPAFTLGSAKEIAYEGRRYLDQPMTVNGTMGKQALLLVTAFVAATCTWTQVLSGALPVTSLAGTGAACGLCAFGVSLLTIFNPQWSQWCGLLYSLLWGVGLGAVTMYAELMYPGVAANTLMVTFGTAAALLFMFWSRIIRVTAGFQNAVMVATMGFGCAMLLTLLLSLVGVPLGGLFTAGPLGLAVCGISSLLAAANLLSDCEFIRQMAQEGAPRWMEWYGAFSLMLTLVWMYTDILRMMTMLAAMGQQND